MKVFAELSLSDESGTTISRLIYKSWICNGGTRSNYETIPMPLTASSKESAPRMRAHKSMSEHLPAEALTTLRVERDGCSSPCRT